MRSWFYKEREYERWVSAAFWVIIGIGILFAAALNPTTGSEEYQNCRNETENIYKLRIESLPSTLNSQANQPNQKTKADYDQEYLENKATCNDLKAQWSVAIVTYIAFCVGCVGILLVYRTLNATRETIKVTRIAADKQITANTRATRAEFQPYFSAEDISSIAIGTENNGTTLFIYAYSFEFKNIGKTSASNLEITARVERMNFFNLEETFEGEVKNLKSGDMHPTEEWTCEINFPFPFPNGDAANYYRAIDNFDIFVNVSFSDMFSDETVREYVFRYTCDRVSLGAQLQSVEEQRSQGNQTS